VGVSGVSKRLLLGRKLRSTQLGETLLPKRIALPVFASDALSSVAYAPDEVFIMLGVAGVAAYAWSWKVATRSDVRWSYCPVIAERGNAMGSSSLNIACNPRIQRAAD
jgi:hypothetical protein